MLYSAIVFPGVSPSYHTMLLDFVGTGTEDRAVATIIFYRGEGTSASQGPRARVGFLGRGQPSPPAKGSGELCKLPSGVWGGAPAAKRFSRVLSVQSDLSMVVYCSLLHSSKFCQSKSYEKHIMQLPRFHQWILHWKIRKLLSHVAARGHELCRRCHPSTICENITYQPQQELGVGIVCLTELLPRISANTSSTFVSIALRKSLCFLLGRILVLTTAFPYLS